MTSATVLWVYIVLLVLGGLIGYLKAGSRVSLLTSCGAAALLVLSALPGLFTWPVRRGLADGVLAALLVVFAVRLVKSRKFLPAGGLLLATLAALTLRHLLPG